jgi:RNA polymerase sigma-70 factor, ECF subfamily
MSQTSATPRCLGVQAMSMSIQWNEAEFEALFRTHYERILRVVRRVLRSDAQADEVCSEVFLRLYRGGPSIADGGQVGGWLYRTATRAAIDALRANQRQGLEELDADTACEDTADGPLTRLLRGERIAQVRAVLAHLRLQKAQLLLLRHSGLSYQEIAEALQISPGSVGTMLARAEAEFSMLYERQQRRGRNAPQLQIAKERR